jgi:hypothetical protein
MILSYSKKNVELYQFPEKIKKGIKIHTLREDSSERWKAGNIIHHATGLRTKNYNCFEVGECKSVQHFILEFISVGVSPHVIYTIFTNNHFKSHINHSISIIKHPIEENRSKLFDNLAINDGFPSFKEFERYFVEYARKLKKAVLNLKIIHFTDFRY